MKKVLFITYYFPPAGGSAVQRILKFAKYLPDSDWLPVVLTAQEDDYVLKDESLSSEIPENVNVYRIPAPDLYRWYENIGKKRSEAPADLSAIAISKGRQESALQRLALFARSLLFVPDARIAWLPQALRMGMKIVRRERVDAILTSSPPFTTALIGGLLARFTGLPWISDYRDPWTQAYFYFRRPQPSRWIEETLERRLLGRATRVVSINDRINDGLRRKYGFPKDDKWVIIPNGYDPEDFEDIQPIADKHFTITYTGTLHAKMHPSPLLEAVKQLIREHRDLADKIRLNFIGRIGQDVAPMFQEPSIAEYIRWIPHLSHGECLRYVTGANLLLLLIPNTPGHELIMTGKLFEYLRSGRPILCLAETGEAAEIIRDASAGFTVPFDDIEQIKNTVWEAFQRWKHGTSILKQPIRREKIKKYDRREHAKILGQILNDVIGH